jgi:nucleoside-diphosphate-sugar epimerase
MMLPSINRLSQELVNENTVLAVTGASGWFGRSTLNLLWEILGEENFHKRVRAFSSKDGMIDVGNKFVISTRSLDQLLELKSLDYIFHYAFLTRDRVDQMDLQSYINANRTITDLVIQRLKKGDVKGVFATSSGAVYAQNGILVDSDRALLENPYGALKRREEILITEACESLQISCLILRVFAVMGAFMTKPKAYAIGDFVYQALNNQHIKILADRPVWRSYTDIQDLVYLGIAYLISSSKRSPICIDSCGYVVEMETLAKQVLMYLDIDSNSISRNWNTLAEPSKYVGKNDEIAYLASTLNLSFSSFENQVMNTIIYLKSLWNM